MFRQVGKDWQSQPAPFRDNQFSKQPEAACAWSSVRRFSRLWASFEYNVAQTCEILWTLILADTAIILTKTEKTLLKGNRIDPSKYPSKVIMRGDPIRQGQDHSQPCFLIVSKGGDVFPTLRVTEDGTNCDEQDFWQFIQPRSLQPWLRDRPKVFLNRRANIVIYLTSCLREDTGF